MTNHSNPFLEFNPVAWESTKRVLRASDNSERIRYDPLQLLLEYYDIILREKKINSRTFLGSKEDLLNAIMDAAFNKCAKRAYSWVSIRTAIRSFGRIPRLCGKAVRLSFHERCCVPYHLDCEEHMPRLDYESELIYRNLPAYYPEEFKQLIIAAWVTLEISPMTYNIRLQYKPGSAGRLTGDAKWVLVEKSILDEIMMTN